MGYRMAARATGSGTISFGLVSIPVKLFSTVDTTRAIRFNYLARDGSRLKQQYIKATDGSVVEREDRVQGYEFSRGQYVIFEADEIKALNVEATNAIEISEFVPLESIDRLYIDKVYYLGPDKGAGRAYHLLRAAMEKTGRAGLARYAARGKSYLVLLRPFEEGLVMEQLKHQEELRPFDDVPLEPVESSDAELDLAVQIVEQIAGETFEPERYTDDIRSRTLELIEQKVQGQEITLPPEEEPEARIIDLMEALKASVGGAGGARKARGKRAKAASAIDLAEARASQDSARKTTRKTAGKGPARSSSRAGKKDGTPAATSTRRRKGSASSD